MTVPAQPLISFIGTTPNIGTTSAAFATAYRLAEINEGRVLFLDLNLKSAKLHRYLGVDRPGMTLDHLRPELLSGSMNAGKLAGAAYQVPTCPQLHVLFGNMFRDQAEYFTPGDIDRLLEAAQQAYPVVVADVSAYWDNAATITVMRRAALRILATTAALSSFQEDAQRWIGQVSPLFGVPSTEYRGIIISPPWRNGGFPVRDIRREIGIPLAGQFKLTESMLMQLDSGRMEEWLKSDKQGSQAMQPTAEMIARELLLPRRMDKQKQPWFRKLAAIRNGAGS
ncbi:hypothetical protein ACFOQM_09535 [Paenibacillus sp. GCM10012307]|uniref:Uncharacterized protein n=1 Tax=Paenibacillus roseus TaxID=2798579 RepID=A0A934MUX4_9BACL|nr:hypothetical protein [Paenibacillus roseus]MBJ6361527.1 hypothetical protein [Paenibacillus roseus]